MGISKKNVSQRSRARRSGSMENPPIEDDRKDYTEITGRTLVRLVISDLVCIGLVAAPYFYLEFNGVPTQQGFYCGDTSIRYPYFESTIGTATLIISSICLLLLFIANHVFPFLWRLIKHKGISEVDRRSGAVLVAGKMLIPHPVVSSVALLKTSVFFAFSLSTTVTIIKFTVGRLRPHFIDVCKPDVTYDTCKEGFPVYFNEFHCLGKDIDLIREARLSFPSGHAASSMFVAVFFTLYIRRSIAKHQESLVHLTIQVILLCLGMFVSASRILDRKHHMSDVLAGGVLGTGFAIFGVRNL